MGYCTKGDIQDAIGGPQALVWLTDLLNVSVDVLAVSSAIAWATAAIDSYAIGTPGTLTTAGALWPVTPDQAKQTCITLAVYRLYATIRREVPEQWRLAFDAAMRTLADLRDGKVSWVATIPPAVQAVSTVSFESSRQAPSLGTFRVAKRSQTDGL